MVKQSIASEDILNRADDSICDLDAVDGCAIERPSTIILLAPLFTLLLSSMKYLKLAGVFLSLTVASAILAAAEYIPPDARTLKIGDAAPDFSLLGVDGKTYTLADFKSDLLMVVFMSNHCPDSHAVEPRLMKFINEMKGQEFLGGRDQPESPGRSHDR